MYQTEYIVNGLEHCEDIEDLKNEILPLLEKQRDSWASKIEEILNNKGYSCRQMANLCGVTEPTVRNWRRGALPRNRDMYLRIGFAAEYSLEEMNAFLKRYGKCPQLYVKSLEDSACMFVLQSPDLDHTYETYLQILDMVKENFDGFASSQDTRNVQEHAYSTYHLASSFANLKNINEMIAFVQKNILSYKQAYDRLYQAVNAFVTVNIANEFMVKEDGKKASLNSMATESRWSSSLRQCVSEIRQKKWFPLRHKVISLGIHLNMDTESINELLQCAQMEPLYAKNPIEATIMWAINEAKLNSTTGDIIPDGSSELCEFVRKILEDLNLEEEGSYLIEDL